MKSHEAPIHTYTNCEVNVHTRSHQPYAGVLKGMRRGRGAVTQNAPHHGTTPRTDAGQHLLRRNASQAALHDTLGGLRAGTRGRRACASATAPGAASTSQSTPSLHGGVVRLPS